MPSESQSSALTTYSSYPYVAVSKEQTEYFQKNLVKKGDFVIVEVDAKKYHVDLFAILEDGRRQLRVFTVQWGTASLERDSQIQMVTDPAAAWGWSYSPPLAVAFALRLPFITPNSEYLAMYGPFKGGSDDMVLQWVPVPGPDQKPNDIMARCREMIVYPSQAEKLLKLAASNNNPAVSGPAERLQGTNLYVSGALHCTNNSPGSGPTNTYRLTVGIENPKVPKKTVKCHISIAGAGGGAVGPDNKPTDFVLWRGIEKFTYRGYVTDISFDDA